MDSESDSQEIQPTAVRKRRPWLWIGLILLGLVAAPFAATAVYRWAPPPISMLMLIRWAQGAEIDYRWTPLERISPHLIRAVVTAEDARLCQHNGVDWEVLNKLMEEPGGPSRGGSTIAMQTAKNLFLWPARSYARKAAELPLAYWIGFAWPKPRLVEIYVNISEWGPGIFGAEAAAQRYFGKAAADVNREEAALLAAALPNPYVRTVGEPGPGLRRQAARVLQRVPGTTPHLGCLGL